MAMRQPVRLSDGRIGLIVRVDTDFPANQTTLRIFVDGRDGPDIAKVPAKEVSEVDAG